MSAINQLMGPVALVAALTAGGATALGSPQAPGAVTETNRAIAKFEARAAERPADYLSLSILGQLHVRHARETGDLESYGRAEAAYRKAFAVSPDDAAATLGLAGVLVSQHEFAEALQLVRSFQRAHPDNVGALVVLGDAAVEIGQYSDAEAAFNELRIRMPDAPAVLVRLAHLAELKGKDGYALELLRRAAAKEIDEEVNGETAAWYQTRIGSLLFRTGQLAQAARSFELALRLFADYHIALDGLGDVRAAEGRVNEAIKFFERAAARVPQPGILMALGDQYLKQGRTTDAERVYRQAESTARRSGRFLSAYRRELANFYANHGRDLPAALDLARQDLATRADIHAYDTLAWSLYKNGRFDEAAEDMTKAMALGTRDATFYAHAGLIAYRRGQSAQALAHLNSAHNLAPYLLDDEARRVRSELLRTKR